MTYLKFGGVLVVMLGLICGSHYYLARCLYHCAQHFFPKLRLSYFIILPSFLSVMMILSVAKPFSGTFQRTISIVGAVWMGLFVYLSLYFLMTDLIYLLVRLISGTSKTLLSATRLSALALSLFTVIFGYIHACNIHTIDYHVSLTETSTSRIHVVMLSDLHLGAVNSEVRLEKIVARINEQNPDLVCIAGDIFDNNYSAIINPDRVILSLRQISSTYGVYACPGNHDAGPEAEKMTALLERANIRLLEDEYVVIDNELILVGRLDPSPIGGYKGKKRQELSAVLAGADPLLPVIVMDHNPASLATYQGDAQLILSGHTHKGQIFPGSLITDAMFTVNYGYGRTDNGTQIIVTSGAGTWGLPIRVGTNCEIVNITIAY